MRRLALSLAAVAMVASVACTREPATRTVSYTEVRLTPGEVAAVSTGSGGPERAVILSQTPGDVFVAIQYGNCESIGGVRLAKNRLAVGLRASGLSPNQVCTSALSFTGLRVDLPKSAQIEGVDIERVEASAAK